MTTYKSYAEAKIANPDCEIFSNGEEFDAIKKAPTSHFANAWVIANPAEYCSTLKEFLDAGFKLVAGDVVMTVNCSTSIVKEDAVDSWNHHGVNDHGFFILSASALNGGCKIPAKAEQWTIYNNTMPLCELSYEQAGKLVKNSGCVEHQNPNTGDWAVTTSPMWNRSGIYRIKPKSERELFIESAMSAGGLRARDGAEDVYGSLFDSGKFKLAIKDGE